MTAADLQALLDTHGIKPIDLARDLGARAEDVLRWRKGYRRIPRKWEPKIWAFFGITTCPTCRQVLERGETS